MVKVLYKIGDIGTEGGISTVVSKDLTAVKRYLCRCINTVEFNVKTLLVGKRGSRKILFINAGATIIIVAAILTVYVVPGVRNIYS